MGDPGLLQELPGIPALLPQGGGDREQSATADGTAGRLDAKADFPLNHRLTQRSFGGVVRRFDALDLQESPQRLFALQELLAGAHGLRPWCSLLSRKTKIHHLLHCALEVLADRPAVQLQRWPVDRAVLPLVPLHKKLLLQRQQLQADLATDALAFGDGGQITDQMRPAQLALLDGQVVVGREAIAHHNAAKGVPQ
jgi:hypothetical protein